MTKRVIIISAHPDDLELGCAGTCKKLQDDGYEVLSIVTVEPSAEDNPNRTGNIVAKELVSSYAISKFRIKVLRTDIHVGGRPNLVADNITMTELAKLVESADIAILPHKEDYHQDHRNTFALAYPLVKNCREVWMMHSYPYTHHHTAHPNVFIDVDNYWDFKQSLLECYPSAFDAATLNRIRITHMAFGLHTSSTYAEAFTLVHKHA